MKELDGILKRLKMMRGVQNVVVVSTSGAHLWGEAPEKAHVETFTTMSAILLGAAHTATKELNDRLKYVEVNMENSRILIHSAGPKAIIVINSDKDADKGAILEKSIEVGKEIGKML